MRRTRRRLVVGGSIALAALLPAACSDEDDVVASVATTNSTTISAGEAPPSEAPPTAAPAQNDAARCTIDTRMLRTAQEAYVASVGRYAASTAELVATGMLSEESPLHSIVIPEAAPGPDGVPRRPTRWSSWTRSTPGHRANQTPADH